jgi:hypothetical protein
MPYVKRNTRVKRAMNCRTMHNIRNFFRKEIPTLKLSNDTYPYFHKSSHLLKIDKCYRIKNQKTTIFLIRKAYKCKQQISSQLVFFQLQCTVKVKCKVKNLSVLCRLFLFFNDNICSFETNYM